MRLYDHFLLIVLIIFNCILVQNIFVTSIIIATIMIIFSLSYSSKKQPSYSYNVSAPFVLCIFFKSFARSTCNNIVTHSLIRMHSYLVLAIQTQLSILGVPCYKCEENYLFPSPILSHYDNSCKLFIGKSFIPLMFRL